MRFGWAVARGITHEPLHGGTMQSHRMKVAPGAPAVHLSWTVEAGRLNDYHPGDRTT